MVWWAVSACSCVGAVSWVLQLFFSQPSVLGAALVILCSYQAAMQTAQPAIRTVLPEVLGASAPVHQHGAWVVLPLVAFGVKCLAQYAIAPPPGVLASRFVWWAVVHTPAVAGFLVVLLVTVLCALLTVRHRLAASEPMAQSASSNPRLSVTHWAFWYLLWQYYDQWVPLAATVSALQLIRDARRRFKCQRLIYSVAYEQLSAWEQLTHHPCITCMGEAEDASSSSQPTLPQHWPSPHFKAINMALPGGEAHFLRTHQLIKDEQYGWHHGQHPAFTAAHKAQLDAVLEASKSAFAWKTEDLVGYTGRISPMNITLKPDANKAKMLQRKRRYSAAEQEAIDKNNAELLRCGLIDELDLAEFACNTVVVAKKDSEGNWSGHRACQDYRDVNDNTVSDNYRLPLPEELWARVAGATVFSKLDLRSGFFQLPIDPESARLTGFWWKNRCFYYKRVPFGLKNAPAHFQRVIDAELMEVHRKAAADGLGDDEFCFAYVDDVLIYSRTAEEHIEHVARVLQRLREVNLLVHPEKSIFATPVVEYLGHNVSMYGLTPSDAKVAAIRALKSPTNVKELRSAMGLMNYYRAYIPSFSSMAVALTALTKKGVAFQWGPEQEKAFQALKDELSTTGRVVRRPQRELPFVLHTDWSTFGIGAVLGQVDKDGNEYMVAAISRSLNEHERKYESYKGEMLAAVWAVKTLRHYLHGCHFTLVTDHQPLLHLMSNRELTGQYARWAMCLQDYDFKVVHRPGVKHQNADHLSRYPQESSEDCTGARLDEECQQGTTQPSAALAVLHAPDDLHTVYAFAASSYQHALSQYSDLPYKADIPTVTDLLEPHLPYHAQPAAPPWESELVTAERMAARVVANRAVNASRARIAAASPTPTTPLVLGDTDADGWPARPVSINTSVVAESFFPLAFSNGVVVVELFGGICAGLDMCLRNGVPVKQYVYCDIDPHARAVALQRCQQLAMDHPTLFSHAAYASAFTVLPQDVNLVTRDHLNRVVGDKRSPVLLVAGWECQGMSTAGSGGGLRESNSVTFYPLARILAVLQLLMDKDAPLAYILENTCAQFNHKHDTVRETDHPYICSVVGQPVPLDAVQFGSYAHRLRNFWTNLVDPAHLRATLPAVAPPPNRQVAEILEPGRHPMPVTRRDHPNPWYQRNEPNMPRKALPTLVATQQSYAFRGEGEGRVYDANVGMWTEPSPLERERIMGYPDHSTLLPSDLVEDAECVKRRHVLTGRAMDARCMKGLMALCVALHSLLASASSPPPQPVAAHSFFPESFSLERVIVQQGGEVTPVAALALLHDDAVLEGCRIAEADISDPTIVDIHHDAPTLYYLRHGELRRGTTPLEARRVRKRAKLYTYREGIVSRLMAGGTIRLVPPPQDRTSLVQETHERCGHFGSRRTLSLLEGRYWWKGIAADVSKVVAHCPHCSQARAVVTSSSPELRPLPIKGLMYRWGVDLFGPVKPKSSRGNQYVMIAIEHFSKWVVAVPIPDKQAAHVAYAFLHHVLARFGACAEVITDNGTEFQGAFASLLLQAHIDHRMTSPQHPQSDGLAERAVQTFKQSLRILRSAGSKAHDWDTDIAWVCLGYNCSIQQSTKLTPYELVYGIAPVVPPAVMERMTEPVPELGDGQYDWGSALCSRAQAMKQAQVIAGANLLTAQQRDRRRYAYVRGGGFAPAPEVYAVGDYVYVRKPHREQALDMLVRPYILRVLSVEPSHVLVLQGRCGGTVKVHRDSVSKCHLLGLDPTIDPMLFKPAKDYPCHVCSKACDEGKMVLCDRCNKGFHISCLKPPLPVVPDGDWYCAECKMPGDGEAPAHERSHEAALPPGDVPGTSVSDVPPEPEQVPFPPPLSTEPISFTNRHVESISRLPAALLQQHNLGMQLDGQHVSLASTGLDGRPVVRWATLKYLGVQHHPKCMELRFDDGEVKRDEPRRLKRTAVPERPTVAEAAVVMMAAAASGTPVSWDLKDSAMLFKALGTLMPGPWNPAHVTRLSKFMPGGSKFLREDGRPELAATRPEEVQVLLDVVDLSWCTSVSDPWCGTGCIKRVLSEHGLMVFTNDVYSGYPADTHEDALQPGFYQREQRAGRMDAIVCSPWFRVIDLAAALAVKYARTVVCMHAPGHFITDAPKPRRRWLGELKQQGRLAFITGLPNAAMGWKCIWVLIFASSEHRDRMLRSGCKVDDVLVWR